MDVQTQVVVQNGTDAQMFTDQKVANFKQQLSALRAGFNDLVQMKIALAQNLKDLHYGWSQVMSLFRTEAIQMYPELVSADIGEIVKTLAGSHPLVQLWNKYQEKNANSVAQIETAQEQVKEIDSQLAVIQGQESEILQMYKVFAQGAPAPAPSVDSLVGQLQSEMIIPEVDEQSLVVSSVAALETLDPVAANMVTLQALELQEQSLYDAQEREQSALAMQSANGSPNQNFKTWGVLAGVAAFIYIFLGDDKKG